jgi:4-amino-4-deoxy-L-arabinose transferase-like glycosyltransferase
MLKAKRSLVIIVFFAVLTRLLYLFVVLAFNHHQVNIFLIDESNDYMVFARNLLTCHSMARVPCLPSAFRTPVYPFLLAGFLGAFGETTGIWLLIFLQFFVSVFTVIVIYLTLKQVIGDTPALIGAVIYSLLIDPIIYTYLITTETLFTFFIVFTLYQLILYQKQNNAKYLIFSGLSLGLSILTRPVATFLPWLLFAVIIGFALYKKRGNVLKPFILLAVTFLVLSPWLLRNYLVLGSPEISTVGGTNLYFYNYAYLKAYLSNQSVDEIQKQLRSSDIDESSMLVGSDFARVSRQETYALQEILGHPGDYAIVHMRGLFQILFGTCSEELFHQLGLTYQPRNMFDIVNPNLFLDFLLKFQKYFFEKWPQIINFIFQMFIFLFAMWGVVSGLRIKNIRCEILLLSAAGFYLIVIAGPQPFPRFAVPAWPIICILAGSVLSSQKLFASRSILRFRIFPNRENSQAIVRQLAIK